MSSAYDIEKRIRNVAPKHRNQYLRHSRPDEVNDPTLWREKPFSLLHFYGCLILFLVQMCVGLLFHLPTKEQTHWLMYVAMFMRFLGLEGPC